MNKMQTALLLHAATLSAWGPSWSCSGAGLGADAHRPSRPSALPALRLVSETALVPRGLQPCFWRLACRGTALAL